jgi:short-subunit dehydrogenase
MISQTALITGASVGIGRELCKLLAADGHRLILVSRDVAKLNDVAAECKQGGAADAIVIPADLSKGDSCGGIGDELAKQEIDVDILINNAGFGVHGEFWAEPIQQQLDLIQVNITSLTHLTGLLLPGMIQRKRGKIMNVASVAAFVPGPLMATYFASKAFVLSFSLALSNECHGKGVSVTAVCPGATATEFFQRAKIGIAPLATGPMMSAEAVARIGYRAMLRGKPLVVTGLGNKIVAQATRLAPKMLLAKAAGSRNRRREAK